MAILTFVSGACANMENPSKIYSWSSYSITVGLSVLKKQTKPPRSKQRRNMTFVTENKIRVLVGIIYKVLTKKFVGGDTVIR